MDLEESEGSVVVKDFGEFYIWGEEYATHPRKITTKPTSLNFFIFIRTQDSVTMS